MKRLLSVLTAALLLMTLTTHAAKRSYRGKSISQPKLNLQVDKQTQGKLVAALEKERTALLNRYKQREQHTQSLREKNQSLAASVSKLENELETANMRQEALQA